MRNVLFFKARLRIYVVMNVVMKADWLLYFQLNLVDQLITEERHLTIMHPVNCYRKLLGEITSIFTAHYFFLFLC